LIWLFSLNETGLMFFDVGRLLYRQKATIAQNWTNEERLNESFIVVFC